MSTAGAPSVAALLADCRLLWSVSPERLLTWRPWRRRRCAEQPAPRTRQTRAQPAGGSRRRGATLLRSLLLPLLLLLLPRVAASPSAAPAAGDGDWRVRAEARLKESARGVARPKPVASPTQPSAALSSAALPEQNIVLTMYDTLAQWHYVCLWHTRRAHPRASIFLAVHFYDDAARWMATRAEKAFLDKLGVVVVNISTSETPRHVALLANYRHASGNGLVYERFCTARFLGVQRVMELYGLQRAATFDMDIAAVRARCAMRALRCAACRGRRAHALFRVSILTQLFRVSSLPPPQFQNVFTSFGPASPDGSWAFGSWINAWTLPHLTAFNDFLLTFYGGSPLDVALGMRRYGHPVRAGQWGDNAYYLRLKNLTSSWWPVADLGDATMYAVTDMELFVAFMLAEQRMFLTCHRRPKPPSCRHGPVKLPGVYSIPALNQDLIRPSNPAGCRTEGRVPGSQRQDDFLAVLSMQPSNGSADKVPHIGGVPVVSIHFNGHCKARFLLGMLNFCVSPPFSLIFFCFFFRLRVLGCHLTPRGHRVRRATSASPRCASPSSSGLATRSCSTPQSRGAATATVTSSDTTGGGLFLRLRIVGCTHTVWLFPTLLLSSMNEFFPNHASPRTVMCSASSENHA